MPSRIQPPFIPATQWTHGEPIDDLKLHRRIDGPLETLGGYARTFNTDAAQFYGYLPVGTAAAASADIPWTAGIDTIGGFFGTTAWRADSPGLYLVSACLATAAATADSIWFAVNGATDPRVPYGGLQGGIVGGGPVLSTVLELAAGEYLTVRSVNAFTSAGNGSDWLFIQQMTWA